MYSHAVIAVGVSRAGEKSFYQRLSDTISAENEKGDEKVTLVMKQTPTVTWK